MWQHRAWTLLILFAITVLPARLAVTGEVASADQAKFFEEKIRPLLATRCHRCHGDSKQKGNLRLDSAAAMLQGGDSGAALVPGKPDESLLIQAVRYEGVEMPPDGKLPEEEIVLLAEWVKAGAFWPAEESVKGSVREKGVAITDADRAHWSFQRVARSEVPATENDDWSRTEIDRFVLDRMRKAGFVPSQPADRRTLIRRLYFDLIGLPPSPEAIESFVNSKSADAYEEIVDQLLDSPRYGEKWARHWLDLVRYAESDGFKQDAYRPESWRYRDYVIRSFNDDKPYDQFIREQLAGDEMADANLDTLAATAYLRHWIYEYNQRDVRTQWSNILNDVTDVTSEVFLGMSVGCARCHDHKFDPILQKDYFRFQAFFAPMLPREDIPFLPQADIARYQADLKEWESKTAEVRAQLADLEQPIRDKVSEGAVNKFPPDIRPMFRKSMAERSPYEQQLVELAQRQVVEEFNKLDYGAKLKGEAKEKWNRLKKEFAELEKQKPAAPPTALTVTDVGPVAPVTYIPSDRAKTPIEPGFLTVLAPEDAPIEPPAHLPSTGRRTALANWIASPENPLTARVIVNRVWQHHFGQGIVGTSSDFGKLGDSPTHPELLDWLAGWFIDHGWSIKELHRQVVTSSVYQQASVSSADPGEAAQILAGSGEGFDLAAAARSLPRDRSADPENRLLSHMPTRRLEAEQIRDAALAVTGELVLDNGGPSVEPSEPRRTIYTRIIRNVRDPLLDVFDAPDNFNSTALRNVTTTPTQALLMMNGAWMLRRAEAFADRLDRESHDNASRVERAFMLTYGRLPREAEKDSAISFLSKAPADMPLDDRAIAPGFAPFAGSSGLALDVEGNESPLLLAPASPAFPEGDFTIEAFVYLRTLYEDATVRTIVSQWDGNNQHPGWAFGVTSSRSKYEPRNLILQLVGTTKEGPAYEVLASNLRLELNRPYYVAASVRIADGSEKGVRFYVKDLSDNSEAVKSVGISHKVISGYRASCAVAIGGRAGVERHRWDGLIDNVRLSSKALTEAELAINASPLEDALVGHWQFEAEGGLLNDTSSKSNHLTQQTRLRSIEKESRAVLIDFCHVLLNSNEFLYVD